MANYHFETREFGISDHGIHLLRSRFNYDTIEFDQVEMITIGRGKELNNWIIIFIVGLLLVLFSIHYSIQLFNIIYHDVVNVIHVEEILIPLIPFMLGAYCLYSSTRNGTMLGVRTVRNKISKFPLKEFTEDDQLQQFELFLKEKLKARVKIDK